MQSENEWTMQVEDENSEASFVKRKSLLDNKSQSQTPLKDPRSCIQLAGKAEQLKSLQEQNNLQAESEYD